jgi:hypothetical protein
MCTHVCPCTATCNVMPATYMYPSLLQNQLIIIDDDNNITCIYVLPFRVHNEYVDSLGCAAATSHQLFQCITCFTCFLHVHLLNMVTYVYYFNSNIATIICVTSLFINVYQS